jgi:hypothetical protein
MKKVFLFAAIVSALFTSCSSKDVESLTGTTDKNELGVAVSISGKELTRAAATGSLDGTSFANNTQIGVFVTGTGYTAKIAPYTLNAIGTAWDAPSADADKIFLSGNDATVFGFYPYDANTDVALSTQLMSVSVPASYLKFDASESVDYMYSTNPVVTNKTAGTSNMATLSFSHALCKVSFIINKGSSYPAGSASGVLSKLVMTAGSAIFANKGMVSLTGGAFTPSTTVADLSSTITLAPVLANYKNINEYNATTPSTTVTASTLVAPCSTLAGTVTLGLTIDGHNMTTATIPSTAWVAGKSYIYTVTVSGTNLIINSVTINPWDTTGNSSNVGSVQ